MITRIEGVEHVPAPDGFASADRATYTVRVVFGGGRDDLQLKVRGLDALDGFGGRANVQLFTTEWTGTDGVSEGPDALFEGTYAVRDGEISIPVDGLKDTDAYLAVIRPARKAPAFEGPVRRHEAEDAVARGNHKWFSIRGQSPLASDNRYALHKRPGGGELAFTVDARKPGAHDLRIHYANPSGSPASGTVEVNGRAVEELEYEPTGAASPFATLRTHAVLRQGRNRIALGVDSGTLSVDYIEATPFRARFEAKDGAWSGANLVRLDMSEANFFANTFSGDAYVRDLSRPTSGAPRADPVPAHPAGRRRSVAGRQLRPHVVQGDAAAVQHARAPARWHVDAHAGQGGPRLSGRRAAGHRRPGLRGRRLAG